MVRAHYAVGRRMRVVVHRRDRHRRRELLRHGATPRHGRRHRPPRAGVAPSRPRPPTLARRSRPTRVNAVATLAAASRRATATHAADVRARRARGGRRQRPAVGHARRRPRPRRRLRARVGRDRPMPLGDACPTRVERDHRVDAGVAGLTALRLARAAGAWPRRRLLITGASRRRRGTRRRLAAAQRALAAVVASPARRRCARCARRRPSPTPRRAPTRPFARRRRVGRRARRSTAARWHELLGARTATLLRFGAASRRPAALDFSPRPRARLRVDRAATVLAHRRARDADDLATLVRLVAGGRLHRRDRRRRATGARRPTCRHCDRRVGGVRGSTVRAVP